MIIIKKPDVSL